MAYPQIIMASDFVKYLKRYASPLIVPLYVHLQFVAFSDIKQTF